jgi:hypothetical protein
VSAAIALLLALQTASPSSAPVRRYAIVIGVNEPAKDGQRPLRYADDDAVRFFTLFKEVSSAASLLTLLDEETQALYPEAAKAAEIPSKERVFETIDETFRKMERDRRDGFQTELYLVYSGHGFVDDHGEGRLGLKGGQFSRTELYERVLARSPARVNHIIIDACDAYFFVQSRGDDKALDRILNERAEEFIDRQTLARFPNTGAVLSTASAAETHEWSEIGAGVFSHEVRSALLGAADADADGRISYDEIGAFVLAANAGVKHANAARAFFVRAPDTDRAHPLFDLGDLGHAKRLHVSNAIGGRITLADDRGRSYADLHKALGYPLDLRLLPGSSYFVRIGEIEYSVPPNKDEIELASLSGAEPSLSPRGAGIAAAYSKGLFALPFGPDLVSGYELGKGVQQAAVEIEAHAERPHPMRIAAIGAGGATLIATGAAIAFRIAGDHLYKDYARTQDTQRLQQLDSDIRAWDTRQNVAIGAAVALGVTAATLLVLDLVE